MCLTLRAYRQMNFSNVKFYLSIKKILPFLLFAVTNVLVNLFQCIHSHSCLHLIAKYQSHYTQ